MPAALIAHSSPVDAASEHAWLEWYRGTHLVELRGAIPEITSVSQYRMLRPQTERPRYIAVIEAPTIDAATFGAKLNDATSRLSFSPLMAEGEDGPEIHLTDVAP